MTVSVGEFGVVLVTYMGKHEEVAFRMINASPFSTCTYTCSK